jgi:hypothetical protein
MSDFNEKQGVSWEILDGTATLKLFPQDDGGLFLEFTDEDGERIWGESRERQFWDSRTVKGEICNDLAGNLPQPKAEVKVALKEVWAELSEHADEYEQALLTPSVEQLIEQTERVEVHGGPETEFDIFVTAQPYGKRRGTAQIDGGPDTRKLTFTSAEWVRSDGDTQTPPIVKKYNNMFYRTLDINWEQWREDIRPAWEEMQEIITDDHQTTAERIAMSSVRALRGRLNVHTEKSRIVNDTWNGWWDDSGDETTIWVPGDTLTEILDEHSKDGDYLGALSRAAKQEGFTSGGRQQTSIDGNPINLYPFPAEVLGVQEIDVIGLESDDDGDGDGEASDGDDGDDGPDSPDTPESPDSPEDADESVPSTDSRALDAVVETADGLDTDEIGVKEETLVAEVSQRRGMPPDEVALAIEKGVRDGQLYRPRGEEAVALRPGGGEPAGCDELPLESEGVPEP